MDMGAEKGKKKVKQNKYVRSSTETGVSVLLRMLAYPYYYGCLVVLLFTGCGVQEHSEQRTAREVTKVVADRDSEFLAHYAPQPQPTVVTTQSKDGSTTTTVTPPPPTVDIHAKEGARVNVNEKGWWTFSEEDSYPLFVKLIGLAVGLFMLGLLVWAWRKQSAAVDQAYQAADEALARQIKKRRERAQETTDTREIAHNAVSIADLEAERGKLRGKR